MVDSIDFRKKIKTIISQEYEIKFLGSNFNKIINTLSNSMSNNILDWVREVMNEYIIPLYIHSNANYKKWVIRDLLSFRYPLRINGIEYRIMLVKVKNSIYIEFHLGDHKYYDRVRKDLNLKKSGY